MNAERHLRIGLILLAVIFLGHSFILVVLEPKMGFKRAEDFFDLSLVVPALKSATWFVSNSLHVALGLTLTWFQSGLRQSKGVGERVLVALCLAAAPLFVSVGVSGFVGEKLLELIAGNPQGRDAALYGLMAARFTMLAAGVGLLGAAVVIAGCDRGMAAWLRVISLGVGSAGILFVFVPTPIPVLYFLWVLAYFTRSTARFRP